MASSTHPVQAADPAQSTAESTQAAANSQVGATVDSQQRRAWALSGSTEPAAATSEAHAETQQAPPVAAGGSGASPQVLRIETCSGGPPGERVTMELKKNASHSELSGTPAPEGAQSSIPAAVLPEGSGGVSEEDTERSDGERSDGERSDGYFSEESDNDSVLSDEEMLGEPGAGEEISTLAGVEEPAAQESEVPPPLSLPPSSYPHQNLPPKTGISIPMLAKTPEFIRTVPAQPEPFYTAPEALFDDIVRQEADRISHPELVRNRTVYDSVEACGPSSLRDVRPREGVRAAGFAEDLPPYFEPSGPEDSTLVFESRFESGNLRRAVQVYDFEYDLILNPDYNTKVHTQWYFFRVSNTRKGPEYRFNIINMVKPTSVYNEGMRPLLYSEKEAELNRIGWVRGSENIAYYQNGIRRRDRGISGDKGINYHTLTFTVVFQHDADMVYFSHCYPYTYTDLQKDLQAFEANPAASRMFRRRKLCETLAGNACDLITITSFNSEPAALRSRRSVVITARVHPGESNASWVMKGMLDYLTGSSLDARILRDNFVFKIIPMLNPDGVIVGNYRCSLAGTDLNRQWGDPSRKLHPTVFFAKSMMRHLIDDRDVILYIDIHGHSRKKNVFMYGNSEMPSIREKIFPRLLSKSSDCFSFDDCCFKIQKSKESTARVVAYRELGLINSFTLEASFCGADFGALAEQHFTTRHLEEMGYMVCDAILDFCDPDQSKVISVCKELQVLFPDDGNSDDVSDSEVDEAAVKRMRRRKGKKAKQEKAKKKRSLVSRSETSKTNQEVSSGPPDVGDASDGVEEWRRKMTKRESWSALDGGGGSSDVICGGRRGVSSSEVTESRGRRGGGAAGDNRNASKKKRTKEKLSDKRNREPTTAVVVSSAAATIAAATAAAGGGNSTGGSAAAGTAGGGAPAASSGAQSTVVLANSRSTKSSADLRNQVRKATTTDSEPVSPTEPHGDGSSGTGPSRKKGGVRAPSVANCRSESPRGYSANVPAQAAGGYNTQEPALGEGASKTSSSVPVSPPAVSRRPKADTRV